MDSPAVQLSVFTGLLFIVISSPAVYKIVDSIVFKIFKQHIADPAGCPKPAGLVLHSVVFALLFWAYLNTMAR